MGLDLSEIYIRVASQQVFPPLNALNYPVSTCQWSMVCALKQWSRGIVIKHLTISTRGA